MPRNAFNPVRTIVAHVAALAEYFFEENDGTAAVVEVPNPGSTILVLPDNPLDDDWYQWANPDNSCVPAAQIVLTLSAKAIAAGVTIQGFPSFTFTTPGTSGRATFDGGSNSWWLTSAQFAAVPPESVTFTNTAAAGPTTGSITVPMPNDSYTTATGRVFIMIRANVITNPAATADLIVGTLLIDGVTYPLPLAPALFTAAGNGEALGGESELVLHALVTTLAPGTSHTFAIHITDITDTVGNTLTVNIANATFVVFDL